MATVIFYEKPGCGGNARQKKVLSDGGHTLVVRDLLSENWTAEMLLSFFGTRPVAEWFNRAAPRVKSGEVVPENLTAEQALKLLCDEHLLIRRPLLQVGDRKEVGWDEQLVDQWIGLTPAGVGEGCPKGDSPMKCG